MSTPSSSFRRAAVALLERLYDSSTAENLAEVLEARVRIPVPARPPKNDVMLIAYADSIVDPDEPPLVSLKRFVDESLDGAFGRVHVLPFYPSSSDDGFAVIDYRMVDHHVGAWTDVESLAADYDVMFDLVINHCSRESLWFADFVSGRAPGQDYFLTLPEESDVSSVSRPRSLPLITAVHTYQGIRHVWNTFSDDQIDLDFSNPDVLVEFVDILLFYFERGARLIRLDAIGYLWKRLGTSCLNLQETHVVVKLLRLISDEVDPGIRLITETNVPHQENVAYFGVGDEAHLVYQFSLPPLLLLSFVFGDSRHLQAWASSLEPPPPGATYLNFFASHDGIGLRPLEGIVPDGEVARLVDEMHARGGFVTLRDVGQLEQRPYEINISLMSAFGGAEGADAFIAAHALMLAFQGSPAFYVHSLVGTLNDLSLVEVTGRTRSINRKKYARDELEAALKDEDSLAARTLAALKRLIGVRNAAPALDPAADQRVIDVPNQVFALERSSASQRLLVVANVTDEPETVQASRLGVPQGDYPELLSGCGRAIDSHLVLGPYEVVWLETERAN